MKGGTLMDFDYFKKLIEEVEKNAPGNKKIPPLTLSVFFDDLKRFSNETVKDAVKLHVKHKRTLPTPKELVDNAQNILDSRRREASYNRGGERFKDSPLGELCRDYIKKLYGEWSYKPKLERYRLQRDWNEFAYRKADTLVRDGTSQSELDEIKREFKSEYIRYNNLIKENEVGQQ